MKVIPPGGSTVDLGTTEAKPTISLVDFSRRVTDDFGVTTVVKRGFSRRMSVRLGLPFDTVDALQRQLTDLRASSALWVADDRFAWLQVNGFYKDFEVDLATPAISFCTLTVEGLAETETVADPGGDPAPNGQPSTLQLIQPIGITDAVLTASNVTENDAPAWSSSTGYAMGAQVIRAHRIYESLIAANVGTDPATDPARWLDTGPTNRWAMFDQALGTATSRANPISVTLRASTANALALLDVVGATVRVQADDYDQTQQVAGGAVTFLDLPPSNGDIIVTVAGSGTVSIGTLVVGTLVKLGVTESSPTAGITDFSRKEVDDFGEVTIVQRAFAKRMTARALIATEQLDVVANRIASVRAQPSLWIGRAGIDSLTIYGFFKDFSIEPGEAVSKLSLTIEGLSKAPPVPKPTPEGNSVVAQGSVDGINWHIGLQAGDQFMRISNDSGVTYGDAVRIAGEDGTPGEDGSYQQQIFRRAATRPATPTGGGIPSGWSDGVPEGSDLIWLSVQYQRNGVALGPWSTPAQIKGDRGDPGENAPLVLVQWSIDGTSNWHFEYQNGDKFQRQSNDNGAIYGPAVRVVGESAQSGVDGISPSIVFIRSATVPATPAQDTGNPPPGWSDDPPVGTTFLWQSVSKFRGGTQLEGWSAPVRISGADGKDGASAFTLIGGGFAVADGKALVNNHKPGDPGYGQWGYAGGRSQEGWKSGAQASFKLEVGTAAGLSLDPTINENYPAINHSFRADPNGNTYLRSEGSDTLIGINNGNRSFQIAYDNAVVRFYVNATVVAELPVAPNQTFFFDAAMVGGPGNRVYDIAFSPAGSSGKPGTDGLDGTDGLNGTNGQSIHIAYADSADGTVNFTTGEAGGRQFIGVYTDTNPGADSPNPAAYGWTRLRGLDGTNGLAGPGGYVHIAYANSANGTVDFHLSDPTGRTYIGTYTDQTEPDSTNPALYAWQLVKGADGKDGKDGLNGLQNVTEAQSFGTIPGGTTSYTIIASQVMYVSTAVASFNLLLFLFPQRGQVAGSSNTDVYLDAVVDGMGVYQASAVFNSGTMTTTRDNEGFYNGGDGYIRATPTLTGIPLPFTDVRRVTFRLWAKHNITSGGQSALAFNGGTCRIEAR